ncbi:MAG TPA: carboxymuconolactone decarboxylase family protein [Burkholderiales bacterium]|nr:carboxymuconolactone decarboxylase family protein [Burkholderiales bacterium]
MKHDDSWMRKGLKVRTEVLGEKHVAASLTDSNPYARELAEFTTRVAWGMVWSRPGLSRKARSFLNLGALIALGQTHELRLHMRAALRNGVTRKEMAEAVLHCAIYAGFPRAAEARRAMCEVFGELDSGKESKGSGKMARRRR